MAEKGFVQVIPLNCPECSRRFPAGEEDSIYYCPPCGKAYELSGGSFPVIRIAHMPGTGTARFPFWIFPFSISTPAATCTTLKEYLSLTGNITPVAPERGGKPPALFVPAFSRGNPQFLIRAGRLLTIRAPLLSTENKNPEAIVPITLKADDARILGEIIVISTLTEERKLKPQLLKELSVRVGTGHLFTIPFSEREGRLLQPEMNLEI